jgi:hypothetical protein
MNLVEGRACLTHGLPGSVLTSELLVAFVPVTSSHKDFAQTHKTKDPSLRRYVRRSPGERVTVVSGLNEVPSVTRRHVYNRSAPPFTQLAPLSGYVPGRTEFHFTLPVMEVAWADWMR